EARDYRDALGLARRWRDELHLSDVGSDDDGIKLVKMGMALRVLHRDLLAGSDPEHETRIERVLRETQSVF
ncbi:MAG TPA: hypothetical protein VD738_00910, partial [Nitrospira sp.]|nr:hypothetical protein [Nitrospira sp.]